MHKDRTTGLAGSRMHKEVRERNKAVEWIRIDRHGSIRKKTSGWANDCLCPVRGSITTGSWMMESVESVAVGQREIASSVESK